ncbi:MAG: DNA primase [Clostridia bacterium]|nr:DNA primase [Clostridia bacterium]
MAIPADIINEIKYRNDIESVISSYVELKRRGKNLVGLCPFHNEKTPSFTVYPENGSFYCFGCGAGGDVFSFIKLIENLDYADAIRFLAEKSGINIIESATDNSLQKVRNTIYDINRETARFFHSVLMSDEGKWAREYLLSRGLTLKTINHFGLGAAPDKWDSLLNHLKSLGYSISDMVAANVVSKSSKGSYYDRFRKRVMFPIINVRGRVVAFSGRAMPGEDKSAKYINTSDTLVYKKSENLFGINFAKNCCEERIILVEGNMDVVSLHQAGFENTVAALGTAFTADEAKLLSRYTKEIVLTLDADAAGQKAVRRAGEILKDTGLNVRVIVVPDGKDPDEYIKKNGPERFKALLEGAVSEIEYKLLTAVEDIDVNTDDGKVKFLSRAADIIADTPDPIARDLYISRLSDKYGIQRSTLENRVKEIRRQKAKTKRRQEINKIINPRFEKSSVLPEKNAYPAAVAAEENIIAVLLSHPDFTDYAKDNITPDMFISSVNRRAFERMLELSLEGLDYDLSLFGEIFSGEEMGYITSLLNGNKSGDNSLTVLKDSIRVINDESLKRKSIDSAKKSTDDWAENIKKIIDNKNKGDK